MDEDFDFDDIPDEDLILALDRVTDASVGTPSGQNGRSQPYRIPAAQSAPSHSAPRHFNTQQARGPPAHKEQNGLDLGYDLDDLSSDAFDSPPPMSRIVGTSQRPAARANKTFRQTNLWGNTVSQNRPMQPQNQGHGRPFRADLPPEPPTHHKLDREALKTWVYPLNLGPIRDYQFSIVKSGLFNNTLVALPTGLGKTYIAATVMLNFLRWTTEAKVVFVAPTKPLASQQVEACLKIAGIPRSQATLLTGEVSPVLREDEWASKRMFFMTPQTLMNDLSKGYADPKSIVLLVVDEAHRATGDYSYVKVVQFMRRFSNSFRVLALTATPGSSVEAVQGVIDNLGISHVEVRTEDSIDIRQYVHSRITDKITFDPSSEMEQVKELFSKALQPLVDKLSAQNIYFGRDPMSISTYALVRSREDWLKSAGRHVNQGLKFAMLAVFAVLQSLAHSIKLLNFHGIKPFYDYLRHFRAEEEAKSGTGSKNSRQVLGDENFKKMMTMIEGWVKEDGFLGHPKLGYLCEILVNHFMDAGEGSNTRVIVFSEFRDSAEHIVRILNAQPLLKATVFVGQADSRGSSGMKQKAQIEAIEKFKAGGFNVLVATSIGEEGLDIGQVDLIVTYDASGSPIRMLQRVGRTGRKRAGKIIYLVMKGKEEDKLREAQLNYQEMQKLICEGSRFSFRHDLSARIVPREVLPEVDKRHVDIPIENTQNPGPPEPKKGGARRKPAKKKFNMPDGVETGFVKASVLDQLIKGTPSVRKPAPTKTHALKANAAGYDLVPLPNPEQAILSDSQTAELHRLYKNVPFGHSPLEEISGPDLGAFPEAQRSLSAAINVKHGEFSRRFVRLFKAMGKLQDSSRPYRIPHRGSVCEGLALPPFADDTDFEDGKGILPVVAQKRRAVESSEDEPDEVTPKARPKKRQAAAASVTRGSIGARGGRGGSGGRTTRGGTGARGARGGKGGRGGKKASAANAFLGECDEDEDEEDKDEGEGTLTPLPSGRGRGRGARSNAQGRKGGRKRGGRFGSTSDHIEDIGDDCTRTSDLAETDGSDDGSDLEGFVVSDNQITSSMQLLSTSPTFPGSPAARSRNSRASRAEQTPTQSGEKPFYVPVDFAPTQDTDDSMPDISSLVPQKETKRKGFLGRTGADDSDNRHSDEAVLHRASPRGNRRRIVTDSDDDDY